ncbi:MAG: hypothetical protein Q7R95_03510, partial [bacterium]|nr:hypothetical protein [bacterium]
AELKSLDQMINDFEYLIINQKPLVQCLVQRSSDDTVRLLELNEFKENNYVPGEQSTFVQVFNQLPKLYEYLARTKFTEKIERVKKDLNSLFTIELLNIEQGDKSIKDMSLFWLYQDLLIGLKRIQDKYPLLNSSYLDDICLKILNISDQLKQKS